MTYVARRKLNFQQLENSLGTPTLAVIKGCATLRDTKLAESSYDKVVMWTGENHDYNDVVRALVRLDRPETWNTWTKRQDRSDIFHRLVPGSEFWTQNKYGPTTLERDSRRTARGRRFLRGRRIDDRT